MVRVVNFQTWLKEALEARSDISQRAFARKAGVSPNTVTNWLRGGRPEPQNYAGIADALGVELADGITDADLDALRVELDVRRDLILAHALVHYIHRGHRLTLRTLNHNGLRWLEPGEFLLAARVQEGNEFWRIRDELQGRFEGDGGRRTIGEIVARREQE